MRLRYWLLTVGYCLLVLIFMTRPVPEVPRPPIPHMDKVVHFALYAGLAAITSIGIRRSNPAATPLHQFLSPFLGASGYGVVCEFLQRLVPERTFDWSDIAANTAGALTAQVVLIFLLWRYLDAKARPPARETSGGS
ncbi:MAG: VanZ family protein [Candidatus Hydrogenedentota bacterium]